MFFTKAYLYFEDNPYYQNQTADRQKINAALPVGRPTAESYEEADLLPDELPDEVQKLLPDKVLFHMHQFMEITRLERGCAYYIVDKTLCRLQPGEVIIFNSFVPHTWLFGDNEVELTDYSFSNTLLFESSNGVSQPRTQESSAPNLCLNIWHTKAANGASPIFTNSNELAIKEDFFIALVNSNFRYTHIKLNAPTYALFTGLLNDIDAEGREKPLAYEYILYAKLVELVTYLFRLHSDNHLVDTQNKPEILTEAFKYISENLHQTLRLETVAKHCYLTPQYFSAYFKKHTGVTFSKYLTERRLERALNELLQTDKSVLEIALQCGFNSKTSFYRAWYSKYQITPSQIRHAYRDKAD